MTSISKSVYADNLDDIDKKQNSTYHNTIKMKSVDIKSSTCIQFNKENDKEDPKFEVGDDVIISKYKHFCKRLHSKLVRRSFCD